MYLSVHAIQERKREKKERRKIKLTCIGHAAINETTAPPKTSPLGLDSKTVSLPILYCLDPLYEPNTCDPFRERISNGPCNREKNKQNC